MQRLSTELEILKSVGGLAKVILPELKKWKIGSKTSNCMFIGHAEKNVSLYTFCSKKCFSLQYNFGNKECWIFLEHIFFAIWVWR